MKKMTKIFGFISISAILFGTGLYIGYYIGMLKSYRDYIELSKRQESFQVRTESYQPSCEDLKYSGKLKIVQKGNDTFIVDNSENYFVVFGFNNEPGKVPLTAWWGASRSDALKNACKE